MKRKDALTFSLGIAGLMIMLLVMTIGAQDTDNVGFYERDPGDALPAPDGAGNGTDEPMDFWMHLPIVATAPRLGIVPPSDYLLYERLDGDWHTWTKDSDMHNCQENCNEWEWNKSWDVDYDGDGDARINCGMESPSLTDMKDEYYCDANLNSMNFDASACSGVMLYIDENYNFSTDDHGSSCSASYGTIYILNDAGYHYVHRHAAPSDSGGYNIGNAYDLSEWAAGESPVYLTFNAYGYLKGYKAIDDACWPETYSFKTFWRIDDVKVKCLIARPDGTIALPNKEPIGRGVYNTDGDGQTISQRVDPGESAVFELQWWNDGNYDSDNFIITGPGDAPGWTVRYFDEYPGTDITGEVTGDGWTAENISGGQETIRVEITADNSLNFGDFYELLVTGSSMHDSGKVDAVKAIVPFGGAQLSVEIDSINEGASGRVTSDPAGIDCTDSCQGDFAPGTEVTLTAVPDTGYVLHYWSGSSYSTESTIKVTMDGDKSLKASFSRPVIVTPVTGPGGTITPSAPTKVLIGSETFWDVTPDAGYQIGEVSISEGSSTCWLYSTTDPNTYRILVPDIPPGYECTLSATFNS